MSVAGLMRVGGFEHVQVTLPSFSTERGPEKVPFSRFLPLECHEGVQTLGLLPSGPQIKVRDVHKRLTVWRF